MRHGSASEFNIISLSELIAPTILDISNGK